MTKMLLPCLLTCGIAAGIANAAEREPSSSAVEPLVRVVDLDVGETTSVELCDGRRVDVELLELHETRDPIRQAVRSALVLVAVDGVTTTVRLHVHVAEE